MIYILISEYYIINSILSGMQPKGTYRIHLFALCYLVAMISYASITTMINGLAMLALVNGIFAFVGFGPSNMIVLNLIRKYNLRTSLMVGFSGLLLYQLNIMMTIIGVDKDLPIISWISVVYAINILASFLAGVSNSVIWTVMPTYIQRHCDEVEPLQSSLNPNESEHKNSITATMGLFWSIFMWSSILGGLVNVFILGFLNVYVYMVIIIALAVVSIFMVKLLVQPFKVKSIGYNAAQLRIIDGIKQQLRNLFRILRQSSLPNIFIYNFMAGFYLNFYPIFMNKLIQKSLPENTSQAEFSRLTAIVFIFQGVGCMISGLIQNKLYFLVSQNKQKALIWGFSFIQSVMLVTMFGYNRIENTGDEYWVCIATILGWALVQIHIKTNTEAYIRQYNGGKVEYYSLSILFYSLGSILNYIVQIIDDGNRELLFLVFIGSTVFTVWILRQPDVRQNFSLSNQITNTNNMNNSETMMTEQQNVQIQ